MAKSTNPTKWQTLYRHADPKSLQDIEAAVKVAIGTLRNAHGGKLLFMPLKRLGAFVVAAATKREIEALPRTVRRFTRADASQAPTFATAVIS